MQGLSKCYIAGRRGNIGSALAGALQRSGYASLVTCAHVLIDLTDFTAVRWNFDEERPE